MTLLSRVFNSVENPAVPLTSSALVDWLSGPKAHAGVAVSETSALGMPAVWRAVNLIAGTCASLPLHAYVEKDEQRLAAGSASQRLLDKPHPDMTSFELWEQVYAHLLLWGNAYLRVLRNQAGEVAELWPLHPSRVKVGRGSDAAKVYCVDNSLDGLTDREVLHIPGFGYDGLLGVSPIRLAKQGIGLALAAEEYGARLFGSGSLASGILRTEAVLDQTQADELKARWKAKVGTGLGSAHEIAVLDAGAQFQQLTIPPEDAQFIESRRFQISEVARIYGVPPHMLMDTEKSTSWGTGIEQQGIGFVVYTLRPWLMRVEQRVSRLLRPEAVYARYSVEGLLRGDIKSRYEAYAIGRQWGWLSTNGIHRLEDQPPVEGGDADYLVPLNMRPLGKETTLKERIDALGVLVRSGFEPEAACEAVGLDPIEHTGAIPVTVQSEEKP